MNATPDHLIWRLHHFDNHRRAIQFVQQFQETLCVFSAPVEQLYTNYEINVPEDDDRSLHLHRIKPSRLDRNSPMEAREIPTLILDRLKKYTG